MAEDEGTTVERGSRPLHEKFDLLIKNSRNPQTGQPYSLQEISNLLPANLPGRTKQYLGNLRAGKYTNPSLSLIEGLATIFKVPTSYFFDSGIEAKVEEELEARRKLGEIVADPNTAIVAVHARGISPENLGPVLAVLRTIRHLEGLGEVDQDALQGLFDQGPEQE